MKPSTLYLALCIAALVFDGNRQHAGADEDWPPRLPGAKNGTASLQTPRFLQVPPPEPPDMPRRVETEEPGAYDVAETPPRVELAFHGDLGRDAISRRLWSSWGDICVAGDGTVYVAIGDHGNAVEGDARAFLYRWLPDESKLEKIVDFNEVAPRSDGQPAWSKVHAKIDEAADGKIYISCTLNDGNRAKQPEYKWSNRFPGGQIYDYDPATGKTSVFASLPPKRCTATSLLDRQRNVWWCNLEAGEGNALWGFDLAAKKEVARTNDGDVAFNRAFALLNDGSILFNGSDSLMILDPRTGNVRTKQTAFPDSPGMRCATRQSKDGFVYGVTHKTNQLFRYDPGNDRVKMLGPAWATRGYTTVMVLSPDERYLYYLPGAHGQAWRFGTPVIQYDLAAERRKVLAFLAPTLAAECHYVPGGSYGVKLSHDGSTLFVNFNGHAADHIRPESMKPNGFGLCAFAAIHIPAAERPASGPAGK